MSPLKPGHWEVIITGRQCLQGRPVRVDLGLGKHVKKKPEIRRKARTTKQDCLAKLNAQIKDWSCEMKALGEKAGEDVNAKCQEREAKLEERKTKAEESLAAFKTSKADSIQRVNAFFA